MKNNKKKIIRILLAVILVAACIGSHCFQGAKTVEAAATRFNGIQKIVDEITAETPFVILELVPDEAYASLGAYVLGEEPVLDARLLKACVSKEERAKKAQALLGEIARYPSVDDKKIDRKNTPMYYDVESPYEERVSAPEDMTGWSVLELDAVETAIKIGYFEQVAEGQKGDYVAVPVEQNEVDLEKPNNSNVPEEPSNPADPVDPVDPSNPADPVDPVEPSEPADPVDPVEPSEPADPIDPVEPSNPVDPVDPVEPSEPADPVDPTEPSDPIDPVELDGEETSYELVNEAKINYVTLAFTGTSLDTEELPTEELPAEEPSTEESPVEPVVEEADGNKVSSDSDENKDDVKSDYIYKYVPGAGTHRWVDSVDDENAEEYTISNKKVYYRLKVTSNNWFADRVFEFEEGEAPKKGIQVISLTPKQLQKNIQSGYIAQLPDNQKVSDWSGVDLLYISNSSCLNLSEEEKALFDEYTNKNDISGETGYILYEYVFNTSLPVIVDSSLIAGRLEKDSTNLKRLAYLLWDYTAGMEPNSYKNGDAVINLSAWQEEWPSGLSELLMSNVKNKNFGQLGRVQGSVYFNSAGNMVSKDFPTTGIIPSVPLAHVSEGEKYPKQEEVLNGVSAVINGISSENFYNEINNIAFTTEYKVDKNDSNNSRIEVSKSTLIKYILNFSSRRQLLYKDTIKILDIEPTRYSTLTEEKVRGWLDPKDSERIKRIDIKYTTPYEFIGLLSDLEGEYDMIYFGDCIGPEGGSGAMYQKDGSTIYNDTSMNGLIYTHVGDTYLAHHRYQGLMEDEYETVNGLKQLKAGPTDTRLSGNDITKDKLKELKAYADAGYPIVLAESYYNVDTAGNFGVDTDHVDNSSFIYEFFSHCIEENKKDNVMPEKHINSSKLAVYLNLSRLQLSMISVPQEYAVSYNSSGGISTAQFLQERDGKHILEYVFELSNISGVDNNSIDYKVQLFVDTNADGRYDTTEELDSLTVTNVHTKEAVETNKLKTGVRYAVERELPQGYVGMLPWKLLVTQTDNQAVHTSEIGYTAVKAKETTTIRVLQLQAAGGGGTSLTISSNKTFEPLITNVYNTLNYKIEFTNVPVATYVNAYNTYISNNKLKDDVNGYTAFYNYYYKDYDMVMMGFTDMVDDISSVGATMALKLFVESGRSVLFSHDTTSHINAPKDIYTRTVTLPSGTYYFGYHLNQYLRSIVGMDRYGITEDSLKFLKENKDLTLSEEDNRETAILDMQKDVAYAAGSGRKSTYREVHGLSDSGMFKKLEYSRIDGSNGNGKDLNQHKVNYTYKYSKGNQPGSGETSYVSQVNKGQITTYPYDINLSQEIKDNVTRHENYMMVDLAKMSVKPTHCQYYQLDMNMDKNADKQSDMVVWYCITDSVYDDVPNDVRNDYYIYSVGNVMYTGMGHSGDKVSEEEAKLFINTIIASYNAGIKNPNISIVQDEESKGIIKEYSYRTYDKEIKLVDKDHETVTFAVSDNNIFSNGTRDIALQYYVEIAPAMGETYDANNPNHVKINVGGEDIFLRKLVEGSEVIDPIYHLPESDVRSVQISQKLLNDRFQVPSIDSVRIFVSAQSTLNYYGDKEPETTSEVFACLTVKVRDLFDLD